MGMKDEPVPGTAKQGSFSGTFFLLLAGHTVIFISSFVKFLSGDFGGPKRAGQNFIRRFRRHYARGKMKIYWEIWEALKGGRI